MDSVGVFSRDLSGWFPCLRAPEMFFVFFRLDLAPLVGDSVNLVAVYPLEMDRLSPLVGVSIISVGLYFPVVVRVGLMVGFPLIREAFSLRR